MESRLAYVAALDGTVAVQTLFSKRARTLHNDERTVEEMVNDGDVRGEDVYADQYNRINGSFFYNTKF